VNMADPDAEYNGAQRQAKAGDKRGTAQAPQAREEARESPRAAQEEEQGGVTFTEDEPGGIPGLRRKRSGG
jgi:hypothetical protein